MPAKRFSYTRLSYALIAILLLSSNANGQEKLAQFKDSLDHAFDISQWMSQVYGFVPITSLITEPALDYGLAGALVFVKRKYDQNGRPLQLPPDIYGIGGLVTGNGSWGVGLGYQGFWKQDQWRYQGVTGYGSFNLDYYRQDRLGNDRRIGFNIEGFIITQEISRRFLKAPWFVGLRYTLASSSLTLQEELDLTIPGIDPDLFKIRTGGLGGVVTFDSRDNMLTPNKGIRGRALMQYFDDIFGSEVTFNRKEFYVLGYLPVSHKLFGSLRLDARFASEETPFYSLPFVELRGIPTMRYQGNTVLVIETEERWNFSRRWSVVGFGGWGKGVFEDQSFSEGENAWNAGAGIRYLLARVFKMYAGVDVARGPEDWAFYITFGSAWARL